MGVVYWLDILLYPWWLDLVVGYLLECCLSVGCLVVVWKWLVPIRWLVVVGDVFLVGLLAVIFWVVVWLVCLVVGFG